MNESVNSIEQLISLTDFPSHHKKIARKILHHERIDVNECVVLYEEAELGFVGALADFVRFEKHGHTTYFNRNFHIEPTNVCVFDCKFCSYSRNFKQLEESWFYTEEEMLDIVRKYEAKPVTEVHIVGGVHPQFDLHFFLGMFRKIKSIRPELHIKAFTPVEYEYMFRKAKISVVEGLKMLKEAGLDSIPGGGAEIFDWEIRQKICADKCTTDQWLEIHKTAHQLGIPSNSTMLYGHYENYTHRVDHMDRLRKLQDETGGFNAFIPLKFRNQNNQMSDVTELSLVEDLKNYAIARIYLDNISNIKAYWPMIGKSTTQLALDFGVNDIDGTIDDSTKIYSMAGAEDQNPVMTTREICNLIKHAGRKPVERDSVYNVLHNFSNHDFESESFKDLPVL